MAIVKSDSFAGMANDAALASTRSFNNALGGSGSLAWNDISSGNYWLWYNVASAVVPQGAAARALATLGSGNFTISFLFRMTAGSAFVWGVSEEANTIAADSVVGLLTSGMNSLRLREYPGGTDHDTQGFSALSTGTWYKATFTKDGDDFTAEVRSSDGTTLIADVAATVTGTTGTHFGFGCPGDGSSIEVRDFIVEDVAASATDLTPTGVTASPVVGTPALSKQLAPTGVTASPVVGQPALGPRAVYVTGQAGGSGTASADLAATGGANRVEATLLDAGTNSVLATRREDVDPTDTISFSGVSAGSRKIRLRDVFKASVAGITVASGAALTPVGITSTPTVGTPALNGGAPQETTVGILDTLAGGARTDVPFMFGIPLATGGTGISGATTSSGATITATVGGSPQNIGVGPRCVMQGGELGYVIVGGVLDNLSSGAQADVVTTTASGSDPSGTSITWADVLATGWACSVEVDVSGTTYTADASDVSTSDTTFAAANPFYQGQWIDTPYFAAWTMSVPLEDGSGNRANDKMRVRFDVYAWKKSSGPVGGGNPIVAILCDPELEIGSWGGAVSSVTTTEIRVKNAAGSASGRTYTGSPNYRLSGYGATDFRLNGVWWSNTAAERGGTDVIHENSSGVLDIVYDRGWLIPMSLTKTLVNRTGDGGRPTLVTFKTGLDGQSTLPMQGAGAHQPDGNAAGSRPDINQIHQLDLFASHSWDDSEDRETMRRNFSTALHQQYRFTSSGLMLDIAGTHASTHLNSDGPNAYAPSGGAAPIIPDQAHKPFTGLLGWLLYGRLKYLRHIHYDTQYMWAEGTSGTGLHRYMFTGGQGRGRMGWCMRHLALAEACTPNALAGTITGWTRDTIKTLKNNNIKSVGGDTVTPGAGNVYNHGYDEYWNPDLTGAITANSRYDNDAAGNARWLFQTSSVNTNIFGLNFAVISHGMASRLNVLDADGISQRDWIFTALLRMVDQDESGGLSDGMTEWYWGASWAAHATEPKSWPRFWSDVNGDAKPDPGSSGARWIDGRMVPGATSFDINAANPAAVVISLNGGSIAWFDDGEQNEGGSRGDWYKNAGRWAGRSGAAWVVGTSPNDWSGRVVSVASNGRSVTIDCTVATGTAPSSSPTGVALVNLALPMFGPASPWNTGNVYIGNLDNDYTTAAMGSVKIINLVAPPYDLTALDAALRARTLLRTTGDISNDPLADTSNLSWVFGTDW